MVVPQYRTVGTFFGLCNDTVVSAGMVNGFCSDRHGFCRDSKWSLHVHQSKLKWISLQINYTYSTNLSSLKFLASFQQQVQPDADISHISETQNEDIPDITHISETQNLLEQNVTHISETHHDSTKLSKDSGNYSKTIYILKMKLYVNIFSSFLPF